jgi:hypothetical protein
MKLTYQILNKEYLYWSTMIGDGRNKEDIRFGQRMHILYDMSDFKIDVFYKESCEEVYVELLEDLYEREEK